MKFVSGVCLLLSLITLAGCGDSQPQTPLAIVSGTVTLNGQPMGGGQVRFSVPGQPPKVLPVTGGAFSGEVVVGKNKVDVVWEKDGAPHPMEPGKFIQENVIDPSFSGPGSQLSAEVGASGASDLKFEVTGKSG